MTTITINRAVVEQAYEALWYYHATEFGRDTPAGKAIAAFHAALAQQAEPVAVAEWDAAWAAARDAAIDAQTAEFRRVFCGEEA